MQISDIFYHNKKHGYDELHHFNTILTGLFESKFLLGGGSI